MFLWNFASSVAMFLGVRGLHKFYNPEKQYSFLIWLQGKKNPATDQAAVKSFLGLVKGAREMNIDRYRLAYKELKIMFSHGTAWVHSSISYDEVFYALVQLLSHLS